MNENVALGVTLSGINAAAVGFYSLLSYKSVRVEENASPWVTSSTDVKPAKFPNPFAVSELAKSHPDLAELCAEVGGCQNVTVTCTRYDDTGNTNLRGQIVWKVEALNSYGMGFQKHGEPIETAIRKWRENRASATERVYPNEIACDAECLEAAK